MTIPKELLDKWKYKTEMCEHFEKPTGCIKGKKCPFAHGKQELRPKRRERICRHFANGICFKSNDHCQFAHGAKYLGTIQPGQTDQFPESVLNEPMVNKTVINTNLQPAPPPKQSHWKSSTTKEISAGYKSNDKECQICWESMSNLDNLQTLKCGHLYHKNCVTGWKARGNGLCPNCRQPMIDENDFPSLG